VQPVLVIQAALTLLLLRATDAGSPHDKRMAAATPYPWPAGRRWLQELGFLACTLHQGAPLMPTRNPRARALTCTQKAANRRLARRRVRIAPVHSRVTRGRIVHDRCRLRKAGVRDLVMEVCGGRQNFRSRLTPWQAMVYSG
jgi:hypothetical protein